jgi:hypothetical protein
MAYSYISSTDITDTVAKKFVETQDLRVSTWVDRANAEVEALAISHDVASTDIIVSPVHPMILDFARSVFCENCFLDQIGTNNTDIPDEEKYLRKYNLYRDRIYTLRTTITHEMFDTTQGSLTASDVAGGGIMWRG